MTIQEHDSVEVIKEIPGKPIKIGMRGAVIHIFTKPTLAYEVEFSDEYGQSVAQEALLPDQVKKLEPMTPEEYGRRGGSRYNLMSQQDGGKNIQYRSTYSETATRKWNDACTRLAKDATASIPCPECDESNLLVNDMAYGSGVGKNRYLKCPSCGAYDILTWDKWKPE